MFGTFVPTIRSCKDTDTVFGKKTHWNYFGCHECPEAGECYRIMAWSCTNDYKMCSGCGHLFLPCTYDEDKSWCKFSVLGLTLDLYMRYIDIRMFHKNSPLPLKLVKKSVNSSPLESLLIGATARGTAATIMHPISVLKTRYESGIYNYKSIPRSLFVIYSTEGKAGLFSGLAPTIARDVPFSALYFMFYSEIKSVLPYDKIDDRYVPVIHFNSGIVAGLLASFLTQPADVMKTHMQLNPQKHTHVKDVIGFIYRRDGLLGFQRGFVPRALRRCLMSAMAWTVYEQMMKGFGLST